jgi:hypothetical protein
VLSEAMMTDPTVLADAYVADVAIGYHTPLGRCTPIQAVAYHEAAHIVDATHGERGANELMRRYPRPLDLVAHLPVYALTSADEAIAESYAAVMCNGGNPVEQELASLLN